MDCEFVPQDIDTLGSGDHEEHRDLAEKANDSEVPKDLTTAQIFLVLICQLILTPNIYRL
jgi:hypothetical protein